MQSAAQAATDSRRYWTLKGGELASQVCAICSGLETADASRKARYQSLLSRYEGRSVSLDSDLFFSDMPGDSTPIYNLIRSGCDTAQADIAGRQKPKPMFLTTGADWKARRRAKKLDKFVEAQLHLPQGVYADAWQLMLAIFHDSAKLGMGIAKVSADFERKKIRIDRVQPWELHVDAREAKYGDPQNLFHVWDMERDLAIDAFCNEKKRNDDGEETDTLDEDGNDARRLAIESAPASAHARTPSDNRVVESVKIREFWRLPLGDEQPGKHGMCIENAVLFEEDWTRAEFPFVFMPWTRDSVGFWGTGLAEAGAEIQDTVNDTSERLRERIQLCSTLTTFYNPATVKADDLNQGGESAINIPCDDMSQAPQQVPVQAPSAAEFAWLSDNKDAFFETNGISQMTAQAQKPTGVTAAVAMQTLNDIQTVRFLPKARGYETSFVTLGKLIVQAARAMAEAHGGFLVRWPGKRFVEEIDWNDVSLDEDMYQIRIAPVSQFSRDPSAILEMAQELRGQGDITRETFLQMIGLPDLEEMLGRETAERDYIEDLMNRYLDSTDADELEKNGGFETPEPFLTNVEAAKSLCVSTYWEAKRDKAPEYCLDRIRDFITELAPKPPPPVAAPPPPMGAMPGAPPPAPGAQPLLAAA